MEQASFVVVGGSSGIGLAITSRLVDRGASVTVFSRSEDAITGLPGVKHLALDITRDAIDVQQLPERIQGLAYCPGSIRLRPFHRLRDTDFEADWQVNVMGAVKAIQACLPGLKKAQAPSSIVLFSTVAVSTGMPFHASIACAKGAVEGLTRSLAAEFAPKIRVNAIIIAESWTPAYDDWIKSMDNGEEKLKSIVQKIPLENRMTTPVEIANTVAFVISEKSSHTTGQFIFVDGGYVHLDRALLPDI